MSPLPQRISTFATIGLTALLIGCSASSEVASAGVAPESSTPPSVPREMDGLSGVVENPVTGQTIYVPVYSSIFHQDARRTIDLSATVSLHNTDPTESITLRGVRYFDVSGKLIRPFLDEARVLAPLETANFVVETNDRSGGTGANFIIEWESERPVSGPIAEAVMIGASSSLGISFVTQGKVVRRLP